MLADGYACWQAIIIPSAGCNTLHFVIAYFPHRDWLADPCPFSAMPLSMPPAW
jgi:hypothetical protein